MAQWIEHGPANQKVAGLIPSQGTCLGCRPGPWWGAHERQPHTDVALPPFSSLKINKILKTKERYHFKPFARTDQKEIIFRLHITGQYDSVDLRLELKVRQEVGMGGGRSRAEGLRACPRAQGTPM